MLSLPQVTLVCVDTRLPQLALDAMLRCMKVCQFGNAVLFTAPDHGLTSLPDGLRVEVVTHIHSVEAYSYFLLREIGQHISTSHHLIVQWDGFVIDPSMWRADFLACDYIGAVWPQYRDAYRVGNGGFSLRSRKLLDAMATPGFVITHPEDVCISRLNRPTLEREFGIRFADEALAHQFAFERSRQSPSSFGFHGLANLPDALTKDELAAFIKEAPPSLFAGVEARGLVKKLLTLGMLDSASLALSKRRASSKSETLADFRLQLRLVLARLANRL